MIRVIIPSQLGTLTDAPREVELEVDAPVSPGSVLDALEAAYPTLRGLLRDPSTGIRRPMIRFFVAEEDISHIAMDADITEMTAGGKEPIWIVAAISGGAGKLEQPAELNHTFTGLIGVDVKGEMWSCVEVPDSTQLLGTVEVQKHVREIWDEK